MDVAFLVGLFPKEEEKQIITDSIGRIDFAANKLQWSLVKGMDSVLNRPIKLFNTIYVGSYPFSFKKILIREYKFSHAKGSNDINIGFFNLFGFNFFFKLLNSFYATRKWVNDGYDGEKVLMIYAIHSPFLITSFLLKKFVNHRLKLCLIVPDLPHLMSYNNNIIYKFLKSLDSHLIKYTLKYIDCFVLLNESMKEFIKVGNRPWVMIEGIYSESDLPIQNCEGYDSNIEDLKVIMYSGNLDFSTGIMDLISAFSLIDGKNYRLWITGSGGCLNDILLLSQKDDRISYFSKLSDFDLKSLQGKATLLINPQKNSQERVKYFFPSKTLEYLASGKPVLMHRLPCIPKEYDQFLFYFDGESILEMRDKIIEVCELDKDYVNALGKLSRAFIFNNKNPFVQCDKINKILKQISHE